MSRFDDLRDLTEDEDDSFSFDDIDVDDNLLLDERRSTNKRFLGMTAIERMFLSMFLFMNVAVLGVALLLATGRIG